MQNLWAIGTLKCKLPPARQMFPNSSIGKHVRTIGSFLLERQAARLSSSVSLISESCSVMSDSLQSHGVYSPWNSPGQNTGVGSHSVLQRIFPTQGSNPGLPHCWRVLYQLSHQGSPRILEWVAYPFFSRSSRPRNQTRVSCIAGGFLYQLTY